MNQNEQAPRVDDTPRAYKNTLYRSDDRHYNHKAPKVKPGTKEFVILSVLAAGRSLNRFEAIRLHDTALNSTISTLQGKGLTIDRKFEKVSCMDNTKKVDVCRYSLPHDQFGKAQQLMGGA